MITIRIFNAGDPNIELHAQGSTLEEALIDALEQVGWITITEYNPDDVEV